jgi:hypothetical protein|tara:strand:+ start:417 stop:1367 length:951 start_codon:yes stop_codon:yes gene_type:complete
MTARSPLWFNSGNLQEMTAAEIVEWQAAGIFVYASGPTAVLTVSSSSAGDLAAMSDTRKQAGVASDISNSAFVPESITSEPTTVTVSYDRVDNTYTTSGIGQTADGGITMPVYYDGSGGIVAMNLTDFKDTFVEPAIDLMIAGTESNNTGGTYTVTTSSTAATGYTNVSTTAIFTDTRADTSLYTAAGIPETLDQPETITNYFLHRRNGADSTPSRNLLLIDGDSNLIEGATATMKNLIGNWIRFDTANTSGQKIVYTMATSGGATRGTAIVDTRLNGDGNYQTRLVNQDHYRSQEFPDGSPETITTYNLRIAKGG